MALPCAEGQPNGLPGTNDPPVAQSTLPMVDQLYSKMVDLFGNPDQTFLMEWPGRVLDMSTYKYPVTDAFSSMQKPQVRPFPTHPYLLTWSSSCLIILM